MKLQEVSKNEDTSITYKILLDDDEIKKIRNETYKILRPTLNIRGFRHGKVPINVAEKMIGIDKMYGPKIYDNLIDELDKEDFNIYASKDFKVNDDFSAECTIYPYQDISFNKSVDQLVILSKKQNVTEGEIDHSIKNITYEFSEREEVPNDYGAKEGDEVTVILTIENIDTKKVIAENLETEIVLGLNDDGIGKYIEGIRKNDKGVFSINIKNNEFQYNVFCKEIWKLKAPDEKELLEQLKISNMEELRNRIKNKILEKKQAGEEKAAYTKLFVILENNSNFKMNDKLVESLITVVDDTKRETFKNLVIKNYKQGSLLLAASKELNLKVSDTEINNEIRKMEMMGKIKNPNIGKKGKLDLRQKLLEQKVIDFMIKKEV